MNYLKHTKTELIALVEKQEEYITYLEGLVPIFELGGSDETYTELFKNSKINAMREEIDKLKNI